MDPVGFFRLQQVTLALLLLVRDWSAVCACLLWIGSSLPLRSILATRLTICLRHRWPIACKPDLSRCFIMDATPHVHGVRMSNGDPVSDYLVTADIK